jgi:cellulose biosynthesis protein BcsQ
MTLALYSNKGGVGKTATAVNLAYLAAQAGLVTLICDLDPQGSTTFYFRVKPKLKRKAQGFTQGGKAVAESIKGTDYENLDLLPADFTHRNLDLSFNQLKHRKRRLNAVLEPLEKEYDLIILDCPAVINLVAENIFNAANYLLIPLIPTTLSVRTHQQLLSFLKEISYGPERVYTFFSMVDKRKKMHQEIMAAVLSDFEQILRSTIPYSAQVEQMGLYREPVPVLAPYSPATRAYQGLWDEVQQEVINEH